MAWFRRVAKWSCSTIVAVLRLIKRNCSVPVFIGLIICFHFIILDWLLLNAYSTYGNIKNDFQTSLNRKGVLETVIDNTHVRKLIRIGKDGGLEKLERETLKRLYLEILPNGNRSFATFGIDVSHSGESIYIYKRMLQRRKRVRKFTKLIVDIGANDGFISSNSFNFIQWGWSAILVEPMKSLLDMAKKNTFRITNPYNNHRQNVTFVQAVIGTEDGVTKLSVSTDAQQMESYIVNDHRPKSNKRTIEVRTYTPISFSKRFNVPKYFGILSIDAEGVGAEVLHAWIDAGFRPQYVVYEPLHNTEPASLTKIYMKGLKYQYLNTLGWNQIYEYKG